MIHATPTGTQCNSQKVTQLEPHLYRCATCGAYFDGEDDGDVGKGRSARPDVYAERKEEYEGRKRRRETRRIA